MSDTLPPLPATPWVGLIHEAYPYEPEWKSRQPGYTEEDMRSYAAAAAALAAAVAEPVSSGFRLVPLKPTPEMMRSMADSEFPDQWDTLSAADRAEISDHFRRWWALMLSAAPAAPPQREAAAVAAERERCAQLCHEYAAQIAISSFQRHTARQLAAAIEGAADALEAVAEPVARIRCWTKPSQFTGEDEGHAELIDWEDGIEALPDGEHLLYAAPAEPPQREPQWVPVAERLPPSGQTVLACYTNRAGRLRRIRAEWIAAKSVESNSEGSDIGVYDEATDTFYDPEGWYERIDNWDDYSSVGVCEGDVTHWMPLPDAPASAPKEQA